MKFPVFLRPSIWAACLWICTAMQVSAQMGYAGTIAFTGKISQSEQDGTGPAVNNPDLNGIKDGDAFTVTVSFAGAVAALGAYNPLPNASVVFADGSISETAFTSADLTVSPDLDPSRYDISFFSCLSTGSSCSVGNNLSANFSVPVAGFNSLGEAASPIPGLFPALDLLEDDGTTDIQGTVTAFSNPALVATPEPFYGLAIPFAVFVGFWAARSRPERHCATDRIPQC